MRVWPETLIPCLTLVLIHGLEHGPKGRGTQGFVTMKVTLEGARSLNGALGVDLATRRGRTMSRS